MVAHDVADVSFVSAVMVRRRTFFQEDPSIVFSHNESVRRAIRQSRGGAKLRGGNFGQYGDGECAVLTHFPIHQNQAV